MSFETSGYYQIPEDQQAAGYTLVDGELVDYLTGDTLIDPADGLPLTSDIQDTVITASGAFPIALMNGGSIPVEVQNRNVSEVEYSLLGVPRSETALSLLGSVNTYGFDSSLWAVKPGGFALYQYFRDPFAWNFQVGSDGTQYGWFTRHLPKEAALQVYVLPPAKSFTYKEDDGTGRYPGGYTDGIIDHYIESKKAFRYQPGRITGFTMGVRMSTGSDWDGESVSWGCRNDYGDGYYFQLDKGTDLFIVRTSPNLPTLKIPRSEWNGDPIALDAGTTNWSLDVSKVTMFKIELGWYGAIGATFFAYVPIGNDDARWVKLHSIRAENTNLVPSLQSPFLRTFIRAIQTAGASSPAFINLYGSSVYIDGGDDGTLECGSVSSSGVTITNQAQTFLGLQCSNTINGVTNQKAIFPTTLSATVNADAKIDLVIRNPGIGRSESYGYGYGTTLSRGAASAIPVVRTNPTTITGIFPSTSLFSSATTHRYFYSGYPIKVSGEGVNSTFATSYSPSTITTSRNLPAGLTSVSIAAFDAHAVGSDVTIVSGDGVAYGTARQYTGKLFFDRPTENAGGNYWRLGLFVKASGAYQPNSSTVFWLATSSPGIEYDLSQSEVGEVSLPPETYKQVAFSIYEESGVATFTTFPFRPTVPATPSITITGSPFPIAIVAELYPGASISDVVLSMAPMPSGLLGLDGLTFSDAYDLAAIAPGSGRTAAISGWTISGNIVQSLTGATTYVANKFETVQSLPNTGALVDTQGRRTLIPPSLTTASFFVASGETLSVPLSPYFGPDKLVLAGGAGSQYSTGAMFVVASTRQASVSGTILASLSWSEQ